ncbi:cysteine desulfurase NifS [Candidatus Pacearchaeota archaeon ex4484_26]|nr:MAG: cysteine desulfurase NifS [Candidatus Pacearchaeota archaeon ex4484_26]
MKVYLDNASTTPVAKEVLEAMQPYFTEKFGNASSLHSWGREAKEALEKARETIKRKVKAAEHKLIFTSSGTESNNLALKGIAFASKNKENGKKSFISSRIEHGCVWHSLRWLKTQGYKTTWLPVNRQGFISLEELNESITKDTLLVSIIHASNEIGTIQNIKEIGKICQEKQVLFHTDACQSFTKVPIDLKKLNIDLLTINSHKIYGPKGVAGLFIKEDIQIKPLLHGGGHEFGLRSSTENVPGIVGFAKAVEIAKQEDVEHMTRLRDMLIKDVLEIKDSWLNGSKECRLCNIANFTFKKIEGESLILLLDAKGIAASTGSACASHSLQPSHVLSAIGLPAEDLHGSIRFSLGKYNTKEEIKYTIKALKECVEKLRKISPL